jgi:hypothetical protein
MNKHLAEQIGLKQAFLPQDIISAGVTGERISMEAHKVAIVIECNGGAGNIVASLQQHDAASAGNSKVLNIFNHYYIKKDAETSFTKTEVDAEVGVANVDAGVAGVKGILVLEVLDTDLDINGGFSHISVNIADPGASAKIVGGLYEVNAPRFAPAFEKDL